MGVGASARGASDARRRNFVGTIGTRPLTGTGWSRTLTAQAVARTQLEFSINVKICVWQCPAVTARGLSYL